MAWDYWSCQLLTLCRRLMGDFTPTDGDFTGATQVWGCSLMSETKGNYWNELHKLGDVY